MNKPTRVLSKRTHSQDAVRVGDSEFGVENHQDDMLLLDPEDYTSGSTHSQAKPTTSGDKKLKASIRDEERATGGKIAQIDNDVDPAMGYLEQETGLPVINNASTDEDDGEDDEVNSEFEDLSDLGNAGNSVDADVDEDDEGDDEEIEAEFSEEDDGDDEEVEAEFDDMEILDGPEIEADSDEETAEEMGECADEVLSFEEDLGTDAVNLVDADAMADAETDDLVYATVANVVHVVRANRIIASMGPSSARKVGMSDVYLTTQFQDVVQASVESKGLRKGLVQSGFVLAQVKVSASKVTAKVVKAKVEAALQTRIEAARAQDACMEQSLAIAAVGINRQFFKASKNELRASLESEFTRMGVRGAGKIIRAMFAQHGVAFAQEILTLAKRISAMPEQVRDEYASALDLTNDEDFEVEDEITSDLDEGFEDDAQEQPMSVTAALASPMRRVPALLKAGVTNKAMDILSGSSSLV